MKVLDVADSKFAGKSYDIDLRYLLKDRRYLVA